ncbi:MAG: hypothetical protein ABSG99_04075 [Sedimentisphaerales bacterium]
MASKNQLTGMTGVYLTAAELSKRGLIAALTSRSAQGADILVTDIDCQRSYTVQVKTNARTFNFWLLNSKAKQMVSNNLIYALVNLRKTETEYYLVPSQVVAANIKVSKPSDTKTIWYSIYRNKIEQYRENWKIFEE